MSRLKSRSNLTSLQESYSINMSNILLESGTNEVEIFEYTLRDQSYGMNVLKVQQILEYSPDIVEEIPKSENSVVGVVLHQNNSIPLLDMAMYLGKKSLFKSEDSKDQRRFIVITEFNHQINGILVDGVNKIHRISWEQIKSTSVVGSESNSKIVGVCHIENQQMMLLDYENIFSECVGQSRIDWDSVELAEEVTEEVKKDRSSRFIFVADDSTLIRTKIKQSLIALGYQKVRIFDNGKSLLDAFNQLKQTASDKNCSINELLDLVITDIEMPNMDGLTLCKNIKSISFDIPVIVLSSLINDQMIEKCRQVGADNYLSKKEIPSLSKVINEVLI